MSTHKAMAARCLSYHQAAYGQPAIRALATAPLRRLALSVLFTIATNSYQTTCTVSERTFNKRQHANARHGVDFSLFTHYNSPLSSIFMQVLENLLPYNRRAPPLLTGANTWEILDPPLNQAQISRLTTGGSSCLHRFVIFWH